MNLPLGTTTQPLLQLDKICFNYENNRFLLNQLDFSIYVGEHIGLIGSNGCGKTTLLHLMLGLLSPSQGKIIAFGQQCYQETDFIEVRAKVGLLFQEADDQLFCPTVAEDVAFGPLNLGKSPDEANKIVHQVLLELGLVNYENRITYRLSGGEKRLVSLATVLAMQPEVLLLDEPTTGLDEQAQSRLIEILQNLPQATLIVSHDLSFLQQVTQRILRLQQGQLVNLT